MLQGHYDVEIIGPILGDGIWKVVSVNEKINIKGINYGTLSKYMLHTSNVLKNISGDIIYVSKPRIESFGIGLLKKFIKKKPVIIDIDDWELVLLKNNYQLLSSSEKIRRIVSPINLHNFYYLSTFLSEKLVRFANEVTVSNRFLQKNLVEQ